MPYSPSVSSSAPSPPTVAGVPPTVVPAVRVATAAFRHRWEPRLEAFRRTAPPPWWAPGLRLTAAVRARYESYLPISLYTRDLSGLLRTALPHAGWTPRTLREMCFDSLPDLWRVLPGHLAGRILYTADELLPLACALASPARFGTAAGRYPEQVEMVRRVLGAGNGPARVVDMACSTGQGTWELGIVAAGTRPGSLVLGVTVEPLEAWMATARRLPHVVGGGAEYPPCPACAAVHFVVGDVRTFRLRQRADVVVCNGLLGGRMLCGEVDLQAAWAGLREMVAPHGAVIVGARFHGGYADGIRRSEAIGRTLADDCRQVGGSICFSGFRRR